ncbi:uncharacterized protein LOC125897589 [Epinephelus fuscoguttatus]|uniref:uncharacterized protein LOC125897589 n=1 Tax=Epinephelus fuscoguttatus TaxID=293821 RepID=UPI0020D16AF0|nr:uncharacterized protein LOC125897589 [Epinephelus fuscoguttatus]
MIKNKHHCENTTWLFTGSRSARAEELIKHGQIGEIAKDESDRLRVTKNCSLIIKTVTDEDAGQFNCQQFNISGKKQSEDSVVFLSVVTMTAQKAHNKITFNCSVFTSGHCAHTVMWQFKGVGKDSKTSQSYCSASVTFTDSHFITFNDYELKCGVTDGHTKEVHQFTFSPPQSSDEKPDWWWYVLVPVGVAALLITVVAVIRWRRTKANMDDNVADPGDDVFYASISYTRKTNRKAQVRGKGDDDDDDGGDVVTYSSVNVSSADLNNL